MKNRSCFVSHQIQSLIHQGPNHPFTEALHFNHPTSRAQGQSPSRLLQFNLAY